MIIRNHTIEASGAPAAGCCSWCCARGDRQPRLQVQQLIYVLNLRILVQINTYLVRAKGAYSYRDRRGRRRARRPDTRVRRRRPGQTATQGIRTQSCSREETRHEIRGPGTLVPCSSHAWRAAPGRAAPRSVYARPTRDTPQNETRNRHHRSLSSRLFHHFYRAP